MIRRLLATAAVIALASSAALAQSTASPPATPLPVFTDVTAASGITWRRSFGDTQLSNIVEGTGSGACVFDYDRDGRLDIYFPQGRWEKTVSDNRGRALIGQLSNALYRQTGGFAFEDVTKAAGVAGRNFAFGCAAADYDNDGDEDLIVLTYKGPELYRNESNGTFTEVTAKAGLADTRWSLNAVWLDYDRDGFLDVFVTNYLEYDVPVVLRGQRLPGAAQLQRHVLRPLPQQRRRHLHRRQQEGGRGAAGRTRHERCGCRPQQRRLD
jgi:hypothetical protein